MKPVMQTIFINETSNRGNCLSACIASILEISVEEVPLFENKEGESWWQQAWKWFEARGNLRMLPTSNPTQEYYIVSGKSPRGNFRHSVVGHKGKLVHDPHPDGTFIIDEDIDYMEIAPFPQTPEAGND